MFYAGWLLFAFLILILGLNHPAPLNDVSKIDTKRIVVGAVAVMVLFGSFVFVPLYQIPYVDTFDMNVQGSNETTTVAGGQAVFFVMINNTGTMNITAQLDVQNLPAGWSAILYEANGSSAGATNSLMITVPYAQNSTVAMDVFVPLGEPPSSRVLVLKGTTSDSKAIEHTVAFQQFTVNIA
jgi:hypothetical protein